MSLPMNLSRTVNPIALGRLSQTPAKIAREKMARKVASGIMARAKVAREKVASKDV